MNDLRAYPLQVSSWTILSETSVTKKIDKSCYLYKGTAIPHQLKQFFNIENLPKQARKNITLHYENTGYSSRIIADEFESPRCRLFWPKSFTEVLIKSFPNHHNKVVNNEVMQAIEAAAFSLIKINDSNYSVELPVASTELISLTFDEYQAELDKQVSSSLSESSSERRKRLNVSNKVPKTMTINTIAYKRNPDVIAEALIRADGICEFCGNPAPFKKAKDNTPYLEVHHIIPLSEKGYDSLDNVLALCPNCHRKKHFA